MNRTTLTRLSGLAVLLVASSQSALAQQYAPTMIEFLQKDGRFGTFLHLAKVTGADSWLRGYATTGTTVLAPTDAAFERLPRSVMSYLLKNPIALTKVIEYHVVPRDKTAAEMRLGPKTVEGDLLDLTGGVPPRTANFILKDVDTDNGQIDLIDQVLFPPSVFTAMQRDGDVPIAVGLGFHKHMTANGVVHDVPIRSAVTKPKKHAKGHWGRVRGTYGRTWIPG